MTELTRSSGDAGSDHVSDALLQRLFTVGAGAPLSADEFDALHRHMDHCLACRARFVEAQKRARTDDQPLTAGQVETILNVVRQKAAAAGVGAEAPQRQPVKEERPGWFVRLVTDLRVVGTVAAAAVLGLSLNHVLRDAPKPPDVPGPVGEFGARGKWSPARDINCFDPRTESLSTMREPTGYCPVGQTPAIHAKQVRDMPWVTMVICDGGDTWRCRMAGDSVKHRPDQADVSVDGPPLQAGQRLRIFTIWSRDALGADAVERASMELRRRGADPETTAALPIASTTQLAHTAVAGDPPS